MITYNHANYISQAIESILTQVCDFSIELIIGEDHSTDETGTICSYYQEKFPDIIQLTKNNRNIGMMANFMQTIRKCEGEYIAFCEGDDCWIDKYKLQKQIDFLDKNEDYSICFCGTKVVNSENKFIRYSPANFSLKKITFYDLLESNILGANSCSALFRYKSLNISDSFINYPVADYFLWLNLLEHNNGYILPFYGAIYRSHGTGVWSKLNRKDSLQRQFEILNHLKDTYSNRKDAEIPLGIQEAKLSLKEKQFLNILQIQDLIKFVYKFYKSPIYIWHSRFLIKEMCIFIIKEKLRKTKNTKP